MDPILKTSRLKERDDCNSAAASHTEIHDSRSDAQSIFNSIPIKMSLPLDMQDDYVTLCQIIMNAEVTLGAMGTDTALLLPEPSTVLAILKLAVAIQKAWFSALAKSISLTRTHHSLVSNWLFD